MNTVNKNRRMTIKAGIAASALSAFPLIPKAQGTDRFAPYRGQKITACWPSDYATFQVSKQIIPEFTKQTGIQVELDEIPYVQIKNKLIESGASSTPKYDFAVYIAPWKSELAAKNCLAELTPFFNNKNLADSKYDANDLIPGLLTNIGLVGGRLGYLDGPNAKLYGIPRGGETSIFAYRKDVFDRYKVKPPADYKSFAQLLVELNEKSKSPSLTQRLLKGHHCVHSWLLHLNPMGGHIFDEQWNPVFNQAPGVEAANFLKLVKETGPDGIQEFGFTENINAFLNGQTNMFLDSTVIFSLMLRPENAELAKNVGFSLHPRGVKYASSTGGFGCGVMENSNKKDASFLFLEWITSKQQDILITKLGGAPNRVSTLYQPDLLRQLPGFAVYQKQLLHATPDWRPIIPQWDELNIKYLGATIPAVISGKVSGQAAMTDCAKDVAVKMKEWGYVS